MSEVQVKEQEQQAPIAEEQSKQDENQPIQPSRGKLDFPTDTNAEGTKEQPLSEIEQKLLQLNQRQEVESSETEARDTKVDQPPKEEVKEKTDQTLPDLAELDLPEDLGVEPTEEIANLSELPDTPEAKKFAEDFQQYLGISIDDFRQAAQDYKQTIEYFNQVKAEQYYNQAKQQLSNEWGVGGAEVDQRLEKVQERFNKYPQEMRDRLDSIEGAKLIWAKIEQEANAKTNRNVPQFQRSRGVNSPAPKVMFTQAEIDAMPQHVYERNADKILRAYQMGLVK